MLKGRRSPPHPLRPEAESPAPSPPCKGTPMPPPPPPQKAPRTVTPAERVGGDRQRGAVGEWVD